jgi:hypothetical protein
MVTVAVRPAVAVFSVTVTVTTPLLLPAGGVTVHHDVLSLTAVQSVLLATAMACVPVAAGAEILSGATDNDSSGSDAGLSSPEQLVKAIASAAAIIIRNKCFVFIIYFCLMLIH